MTEVLKLSSYDELLSSIPHMLGFTPAHSVVCLALGEGPVARVDLPDRREDIDAWVRVLTEVYLGRHHPRRVALVAYGDDRTRCVEALAALTSGLIAGGADGPAVGPVLWVDGNTWTDLLEGTQRTIDPAGRARIDAEFALRGRVMPAASRADLARALRGDPTALAGQLPAAAARFTRMDRTARAAEVGWLIDRLDQFRDDRTYLSDVDAARLLTVVEARGVRDAIVSRMGRRMAAVDAELWQDLVRRAPSEVRDTAATLLALSSYLDGRGAQAWVALDRLSNSNTLADLIGSALEHAVDPREWDAVLSAPTRTLMQQAALRDQAIQARAAQERSARRPGPPDATNPDASAPGR